MIPGYRPPSIFDPPTDVKLIYTMRDGGKIGKHSSIEDYVHESAAGYLSHPFGRVMATRLIAEDKLLRMGIPVPKKKS